ncbi:MAG: hypothetical protein IKN98_07155 [Bacteroidales bacterium]|nr:hypothetical protein [Bacteroidales bacterium]
MFWLRIGLQRYALFWNAGKTKKAAEGPENPRGASIFKQVNYPPRHFLRMVNQQLAVHNHRLLFFTRCKGINPINFIQIRIFFTKIRIIS